MALLSVQNVSIRMGGALLLQQVDLLIERQERVCLLGRNGSGKTTLMKLINGELPPDSGVVSRSLGISTARLDQEIPPGISGSVIDVVTSGLAVKGRLLAEYHHVSAALAEPHADEGRLLERLDRLGHQLDAENGWEIHRQVDQIIARMNLPAEMEFASLSTGLKRRTLLARALVSAPDILLLDEPTNHLDIAAITWLEEYLAAYAGTLIVVTHDRMLVQRLASRIVEIDCGRLFDWKCDYSTFLRRKEERLANEVSQNDLFDKKLAIEEEWIRQGIKARRTRNEGRVKALERMREERRQRRERPGQVSGALQTGPRSGSLVIDAVKVSFGFGEKKIISGFSTSIMRRDRVGVIGPNGCGKTTLLRLLLGELKPQAGQVRLGTNLEVCYFDQLRDQLDGEKSVLESVADGSDWVTINGKPRHVAGYLQGFLFSAERARAKVKSLSGGERCRLLLARLFARTANVLVLDEPTNDLDIETLEFLEEALLDFEGTLLLVSHDRAFLNNVVTGTLVFSGEGRVEEFVGGYDDWLEQRAAPEAEVKLPASRKQPPLPKPAAPKLTFKETRELEALPEQIRELEEEQKRLWQALGDPEIYRSGPGEAGVLNNRLQALEHDLAAAYLRWETLEELKTRVLEAGKK